MTSGDHIRTSSEKARKFWHSKGSWVLLALVGVSMFLAGNSFHAYQTHDTVKILQSSFDTKEAEYRDRIRELTDKIQEYLPSASAAGKASTEVAKQVQETKQAVEILSNKLDATEKGGFNGKDNSEASGK